MKVLSNFCQRQQEKLTLQHRSLRLSCQRVTSFLPVAHLLSQTQNVHARVLELLTRQINISVGAVHDTVNVI